MKKIMIQSSFEILLVPLFFLLFVIPFENVFSFELADRIVTLSQIIGIISIPACLVFLIRRNRFHFLSIYFYIVIFFIWSFVTILWTIDIDFSVFRTSSMIQLFFFFVLVTQMIDTQARFILAMELYVLGALVSSVFLFYNFSIGEAFSPGRYAPANFHPNDAAYILALAIPMSTYLSRFVFNRGHSSRRLLYMVLPAAFSVAVIMTGSRGGFVALSFALIYYFAPLLRFNIGRSIMAGAVITTFATLGIWLDMTASLDRIQTVASEFMSGEFGTRHLIWRAGFAAFGDSVFVGQGIGSFPTAVSAGYAGAISAHNVFLQLAVETGVVGLILFVIALWAFISKLSVLRRDEFHFWVIQLSILAVPFFIGNWFYKKQTWLVLALLVVNWNLALIRRKANYQTSRSAKIYSSRWGLGHPLANK